MEKIKEKEASEIITLFNLTKKSRKPIVTDNRFLFYRYLNEHGYTLKQIAKLFNTTHPNVLYGVRKSKQDSVLNKTNYVKNTEQLREYLNNNNTDLKRLEVIKNVKDVQQKLDVIIEKINAFNEATI
tara:strand:- start:715 stop:1095 length:381 start_codon:yes stop_codon:yes gene_type:complete